MTEHDINLAKMFRVLFVVLAVCMAVMTFVTGALAVLELLSSRVFSALASLVVAALFALASNWANKAARRIRADIQAVEASR